MAATFQPITRWLFGRNFQKQRCRNGRFELRLTEMKSEPLHSCGQSKGEIKEKGMLTWEQYIEPGLQVHSGLTSF